MPDNHPQLGRVLSESEGVRDAIHIAIIPVIIGNRMTPGSRVAYNAEANRVFTDTHNTIGVIDPFLPMASLAPGTRVYLFLDPYTITSLSHHWTHPAFPVEVSAPPSTLTIQEIALKTISEAAEQLGYTRGRFMQILDDYAISDEYEQDNSESYKRVDVDWRLVWSAWVQVTGRAVPKWAHAPFTCSC